MGKMPYRFSIRRNKVTACGIFATMRCRSKDPAVARKQAVILHRMWANGSEFRWGKQAAATAVA
jgi:hypothetical protein